MQYSTVLITLFIIIIIIIGYYITSNSMKNGWYSKGVHTSVRQPPSYIFGIVWFFIYIGYIITWSYLYNKIPAWLNVLFFINMILNIAWVYIFFNNGNIQLSQVVIVMLLILTVLQAVLVYKYAANYTPKKRGENNWFGVCTFFLFIYASWLLVATGLNSEVYVK